MRHGHSRPRPTRLRLRRILILAAAMPCAAGLATAADAQERWTWPERAENLQQLPKDFPGSRLRAVMTGFTRALGVRCSHCHVGEEGAPLSSYDFVSDERREKRTAREMLALLGSVNDHLDKIETKGKPINMWCHTCHRGRPIPMTLGEELTRVYEAGGVEAALAEYTTLRERFYGRGAYDFGEGSLNQLGYALLQRDDVDGAIAVLARNVERFPDSANVYDSLGEAYMKAGKRDLAIANYEKSLALDPSNDNAAQMLRKLREGGESR